MKQHHQRQTIMFRISDKLPERVWKKFRSQIIYRGNRTDTNAFKYSMKDGLSAAALI